MMDVTNLLTIQYNKIKNGNDSLGKPIMKYVTVMPGMTVRRPMEVVVSSARNAASTEYVLFAFS